MCKNTKDSKRDTKTSPSTCHHASASRKAIFSSLANADPSARQSDSTPSKSFPMILSELPENSSIYFD